MADGDSRSILRLWNDVDVDENTGTDVLGDRNANDDDFDLHETDV